MASAVKPMIDDSQHGAEDQPAYYNISQAAARLGVSRVSIWRWIRDGELAAARIGQRTTRIRRDELEGLLLRIGTRHSTGRTDDAEGRTSIDDMARGAQANWAELASGEHFVQFYENDEFLVNAVTDFVGSGLVAGEAGIVIATEAHRRAIAEGLRVKHDLDVAEALAAGRFEALDADETLAMFMVDGLPDPALFAAAIGPKLAGLARHGRPVRAFGEMVALLAMEGNGAGTVSLEGLWNDLRRGHSFSLFCGYPMDCLKGEALTELLSGVCAEHGHVIPTESFMALETTGERLRAVTALQQKAESLELEIAQRKQAEQQLTAALNAATSALRARDVFLSIAAHELKTPTTSIKGHAQMALRWLSRDGQTEGEQLAQALHTIDGQAGKLSRLVSQLFDVSQLDAGALVLNQQPADLIDVISQTVGNARLWSTRHQIVLEAPSSVELSIDPLRIEQVIANLLDNAIKYSPAGGRITVLVEGQPTAVQLSVADQGLGIPAEQRANIFDRFYQAHVQDHRSGMGLGLYVSRQIVELHGGEIRAEFPESGGSRFVIGLPRASASQAAAGVAACDMPRLSA